MTSLADIAASYAAERSYQHDLDNAIDSSNAVLSIGNTKESTTELTDLSGTGNTGTIHGAMPSSGFFFGRRFGGSDRVDAGNDVSLDITDAITISAWIKPTNNNTDQGIISKGPFLGAFGSVSYQVGIQSNGNMIFYGTGGPSIVFSITSNQFNMNQWNHITGTWNGSAGESAKLYINSILKNTDITASGTLNTISSAVDIGGTDRLFLGSIATVNIYNRTVSVKEIKSNYNTFARLQLWSINYTDYPNNVSTYTDRLPYSSTIIPSGTFKVDADVLNCVSAGTIIYRAAHEFDGSEYITVTIDGTEYSGTETITEGNTTVSIAQGSNKITIVMGTGDTIEGEVKIQFREEV